MLQATVPMLSLALWPLLPTSLVPPPPYLQGSFTALVGLPLFTLFGMPSHVKKGICFT